MRRFLLAIALSGAILCSHAQAQTVPDDDTIRILTNRFKHILHDVGINGVGRDVQACYDVAWLKKSDPAPLRKCMLYDVAAYRLDTGMHYAMSMRGATLGQAPYFSADAFSKRFAFYTPMAFNGSAKAANTYLMKASTEVMNGAVQ